MSNEILSWEITPLEKRQQVQEFISKTWLIWICFIVVSLSFSYAGLFSWTIHKDIKYALINLLYIIIGIAVCIWLFFIINKFIPYKLRTYYLDGSGITISKGKKKKYFSWDEFEYFYPYHSYKGCQIIPKNSKREQLLEVDQQIEGQIFYLKKKPTNLLSKFYKTFVVIYSEPDNSKRVLQFLNKHLPQKKITLSSDLGLVFYQFK